MENVHRLKDLAPRDIVTRAILADMERTGDEYALLDVSGMTEEFFSHRFPTIYARCKEEGIDVPSQPIPIHPAQHYFMGGIVADLNGMTNIDGLYAAGECACTGIHGANRLASNSMLECLVFGRRVARHIDECTRKGPEKITLKGEAPSGDTVVPRAEISCKHEMLRKLMSKYVGAVKTREGLTLAKNEISKALAELEDATLATVEEFELYNMGTVADAIVTSALARRHSVGAHYIVDANGNPL